MTSKRLEIGDTAPDFALQNQAGQTVGLSDFRGRRVILYFYPKDNTSGCTKQACGFRDAYSDVVDRNAVVLGVSPDDAASHVSFINKYELPFQLLVDADHAVAEVYGVWTEKTTFGRKHFGILRSHFVIDEQGRIADARYRVSPAKSVELALAALDAMDSQDSQDSQDD